LVVIAVLIGKQRTGIGIGDPPSRFVFMQRPLKGTHEHGEFCKLCSLFCLVELADGLFGRRRATHIASDDPVNLISSLNRTKAAAPN